MQVQALAYMCNISYVYICFRVSVIMTECCTCSDPASALLLAAVTTSDCYCQHDA
jgi:hypothetical protein